jgi:hypothetical protein
LLLEKMNLRGRKSKADNLDAEATQWCNKRDPPWIVEGDAGRMGECLPEFHCNSIRTSNVV